MELVFTVGYGVLIGYEISLSFDNPDIGGLGYVIFILLAPVAFQQSCVYIVNEMVRDRETKMKESLRIMGLNKYMYALSFLVQRGIWTTMTCLIMAIMTYALNSDQIGFGAAIALFLALWLLALDFLALSLFIQNFFSNPKLAAVCAPFLFFLPTGVAMLGLITPVTTLTPNNWVQYIFFLPTFPFEVILTEIFQPDSSIQFFEVSAAAAWIVLVLLTPIYFFLHIYVEAIMPDAYGVTESCCFCFRKSKKPPADDVYDDFDDADMKSTINEDEEVGDPLLRKSADDDHFAPIEEKLIDPNSKSDSRKQSALRRNTEGRKAFSKTDPIQLKRMSMLFGQFRAVDKLTLSIKQDEIISLLGHNGAGKTTAIYMLTGMLMPSEGDAIIHGNSIKRDTDEVRRSIGLCQ